MKSRLTRVEPDVGSESSGQVTQEEAELFAPLRRPLYPTLIVIDDGKELDGESIRIRAETFMVGRESGDLVLPAEQMMSSSHFKISLDHVSAGVWIWNLHDLDSRHGVFVRLEEFGVVAGNEWLAGSTKFVISGPASSTRNQLPQEDLVPYRTATGEQAGVHILGYNCDRIDSHISLAKRQAFGASIDGSGRIVGDPFVDAHQFTLQMTDSRTWQVTNFGSTNGTWLRVQRLALKKQQMFLAGEQRFSFVP